MSMTAEGLTPAQMLEIKDAEQKEEARKRHAAARKALEDEQALHRSTVAKETEEKKAELDLFMEGLTEGQRRTVRMEAYLHVLRQGYDHSQLQSSVDATTLRLARYMIDGHV